MNDRRGHRKLRLCSNKYYEKRKYFPKMLLVSIPRRTISVLKVSIPMDMLPFRVSLPLSVYKELAVPSLEVLHGRVQRLDTLDEEWSHMMHQGTLSLYQTVSTETGLVIGLSLMIKADFSWTVSYRNQLVPLEHCLLLQSAPTSINSVDKLSQLVATLNGTKVCEGNSDEQFTSLPSVRNNVMKNQSRTDIVAKLESARTGILSIFHVDCEVLIKSAGSPARCTSCKKHRRSLSAITSRIQKDERTHPSSHTNYSYLSSPEKDERLHRLHTETKVAKLRIARLEKRITEVTDEDGEHLDDEMHNDMKQMIVDTTEHINNSYQQHTFQQLFWEQQRRASSLKDSRSMKWHPLFIKWCLYLRHLSGKSYEMLRESGCVKLPSQRTLRDYTHYIKATVGFSSNVDQHLVDVADLSQDLNKYVILIMDEVHVKEELVYDKHEGCLIGFVNLGDTNNQLLDFEAALSQEKSSRPLASTMLVLMVRGLFQKLNYPYAQFACSNLSGDQLFDPVWEAISRLEILGFKVLALTCDGASPNRRLWKLHCKDKSEMTYKVPNPYASDSRDLYFISDPPHLLKTIRNSWFNSKRKLWCNGKYISWKHLENFYIQDTTTNGLRLVPKLKYEHIYLTSFSKMRVDLAAQVLSESVANGIEHVGGEEATETVKFIRMMDKLFDCLNVTNFSSGKTKRKPFQDPYRPSVENKEDFRLKWLREELLPYLEQWEDSVDKRTGFNPKDKAMMLITKETRFGIRVTVNSFLELTKYILSIPGVKVFLSERLSQDPLEKFFSCQRQRGKSNENPSVQQFCKNTQALRVINGTCGYVSRSNCRGNKTTLNWDKESCPIPKRHRTKQHDGSKSNSCSDKQDEGKKSVSKEQIQLEAVKGSSLSPLHHTEVSLKQCNDSFEGLRKDISCMPVVKECEVSLEPAVKEQSDHHVKSTDVTTKFTHDTLQEQQIDRALGNGTAVEELSNGFHISLRRCDFWLLRNKEWLNDKIINFYMNLITERNQEVFAFSTFFYPKLVAGGFDGVSNWMKDVNLFNKQLLLIPIHLQMHWCLATVDFKLKQFCYYDSLRGVNNTCLQLLKEYIQQKASGCKSNDHTFSVWSNVIRQDIPQQYNSYDCGVFVCMYARLLSEKAPLNSFSQTDMALIRKHMVLELLSKKLI